MIRYLRLHGLGDADRPMNSAEIVVREVPAESGPEVVPLHARGEVLALDMRGADAFRIGSAGNWGHLHSGDFGGE